MAKKKNNEDQKKMITKENWVSSFSLVGKPKLNDFTFKIDEKSESSSWIYNSMRLGVDCGEECGVVYCEMMGGYSEEQPGVLYARGKNEDGTDNFEKQLLVSWEDRFDEDVLEDVADSSFIRIALKKTTKGSVFTQKFLSPYDAIAYIKDNITEDMVIHVRGALRWSMYNGNVQVRKVVNRITLVSDPNKATFGASFSQSILVDKNSVDPKNIDTEKQMFYVDARVLDYVKEYDGKEIKGQFPFNRQFEYEYPNAESLKMFIQKVFKPTKGITQINYNGDLIEGGAVVTATWDDVPDDLKELVAFGEYTKEEMLARCSISSGRELRMVLRRVMITRGDADTPSTRQMYPNRYTEEDLSLDYLNEDAADDEVDDSNTVSSAVDDMAWLKSL